MVEKKDPRGDEGKEEKKYLQEGHMSVSHGPNLM